MSLSRNNVVHLPVPFLEPVISPEEAAFLAKTEAMERKPGPLLESSDSIMLRAAREALHPWPAGFPYGRSRKP